MRKTFFLWVFVLLVSAGGAMAQTPTTHAKAAENMLIAMGTPKSTDDNVQQMLTMQFEQMPAMKAAEVEVRSFFSKYMTWDAIKDDLIKLYTEEFTEKELNDMTKFYNTPTGKKMAAKQTQLTMKATQIGQSKLQPHMMELEQIIRKKMQDEGSN